MDIIVLEIINELYEGESDIRLHQAPSGHLYLIKAIQFTNSLSASNRFVIDRANTEDQVTTLTESSDTIFAVDLQIDGVCEHISFPDGIKAKYISFGFNVATAPCVSVRIYYELIKVSDAEIVWEFLKRGKNP